MRKSLIATWGGVERKMEIRRNKDKIINNIAEYNDT